MARDGIRVTLTLSGGASLGAFQAGNAAALLVAFFHLREEEGIDVRVDALGGASAGALVSLMTAHSLLSGADPVKLLSEAWVERVGIETLFQGGGRGPLTFGKVRRTAPDLLAAGGDGGPHQDQPLILNISLTGLQGLTYELEGVRDEPVIASSYDDWGEFELQPGGGIEQLVEPSGSSPLDFVLASASHPGAFAPRVLDRSGDEDGYRSQGVHSFPESGHLWYTDGGLIQSKPLGRVLSAARRIDDADADVHRLDLMIDPRSEEPSAAKEWSDPDLDADWASGLSRALAILPAQALYDDLRAVERDNRRIRWAEELVEALLPHLDEKAAEKLRPLAERIAAERQKARGAEGDPRDEPDDDADTAELLKRVLGDIGGLTGKNVVSVDVLSPLILAEETGEDVPSLLAGELLGDFGGFLAQDLRRSDFALGYETTIAWAKQGLEPCGVDADAAERTVEALKERCPYEWEDVRQGRTGHRDLPWRARLNLARLFARAGRSVIRGSR